MAESSSAMSSVAAPMTLAENRPHLLALFTHFCGAAAGMSLTGWLSLNDAFDISPCYLSIERCEEAFDDALKAKCVGWLADDVAAIRIAATRNLRLLAAKFGERWARDVALPKVADLARQRYYLRRITALRALDALCDVLAPEDVAADVLATVLDLCDDPVANVRFNAAATLRKLAPRLQRQSAELALLKTKPRSLADDDGDVDVVAIASEAAAAVDGDE